MEKTNLEFLKNSDDEQRRKFLIDSIPNLGKYESRFGSEGTVFFVDDDIIIKKYFPETPSRVITNELFEKYCKECENYYRKGYGIPEIYSWAAVPRTKTSGIDYYLLEQRVSGRELFLSNIEEVYQKSSGWLNKRDFFYILQNPESSHVIYKKILFDFISDFREMNEKIESMPEDKMENFVWGVYGMLKDYYHAIPDVHAGNILYHENEMKLIDLFLETDESLVQSLKLIPAESLLFARMIALFDSNADIKKYLSSDSYLLEINELIAFNEVICFEAMKKFIKVAKRFCDCIPPNEKWWNRLILRIERILAKENAEKIIKEIAPIF